ncbi:piRNA biogenesis protein EXD1 [Haematobia irritans]|uniref:piRNA biogenesis protein EXD1 n=1 Tax=Haematobia irritans TaxID=7368 RepID=UPI003F502297
MPSPEQIINSLCVGQLLLVETNRELLMGTLSYIDMKRMMLELENVRDVKTNYSYQSPQMLAYQQMKSIKIITETNLENPTDSSTETEELLVDIGSTCNSKKTKIRERKNSTSSKEQCEALSIQLSALDFQILQTQYDSMVYITQTDHKYHKALADIRTQSVIGLLIDPIQTARHRKTSLIITATSRNIYIFDMISLGRIFKEFRLILEAERPKKAVHFSHRIVDHFKHRHDLELAGIFDTFVAYCMITGDKSNKSLEETVQHMFSLSDIYFQPENEISISSDPYGRPLCSDYLLIMAKKVAFQLKLYDHLLHEHMLQNFYKQCHKFSQTLSQQEDGFEVAQQLHPNSKAGHEYIQPNGNWKDILETEFEIVNNRNTTQV